MDIIELEKMAKDCAATVNKKDREYVEKIIVLVAQIYQIRKELE